MPTSSPDNFQILRAQSGDLKAYDTLLKEIQAPLYQYLVRLTGDMSLAKDILQEVFLIIFRKLPTLNNPTLFRPWVFRLASREAFRYLKKQKFDLKEPSDWAILENMTENTEEEDSAELNRYLEALPELLTQISVGSRAVILLHFIEGLKLKEVADVLDLPLGTVKSRLAYGLESLRRLSLVYKTL